MNEKDFDIKNEDTIINYNNQVEETLKKIDDSSYTFKHNKKEPKKNKINKKKLTLIIIIGSILTILLTILIVFLIRTSSCNKTLSQLLNEDYYSKTTIETKLSEKGYNSLEINYVLKKNNINFNNNLINKLYKLIAEPKEFKSKDELISELKFEGFIEEDIISVFDSLDWHEFLNNYLNNYIKANGDKVINKIDFIKELKALNFTNDDINFIENLDVWNEFAEEYLKDYFNENKSCSKEDAKNYLLSLGIKEDDINSLFIKVDWNKQALACITSFINETNDSNSKAKDKTEITIKLISNVLKEKGFSDSEIKYAVDNYDFSDVLVDKIKEIVKSKGKIVNKEDIIKTLKTSGYDEETIKESMEKITWDSYCSSTLIQILSSNKANKTEAIKTLKTYGYSEEEIEKTSNSIKWSDYCYKALNYMEDNNSKTKDALLNTLKDYGYSEDEIMVAKKNTNFNKFAYNYLLSKKSSTELKSITPNEISSILSKADYSEQKSHVLGKFVWSDNALEYLKIELTPYINEAQDINFNTISTKMKDNGFASADINKAKSSYLDTASSLWANSYIEKSEYPCPKDLKEKFDSMGLNYSVINVNWQDCANKYALNLQQEGKSKEQIENDMDKDSTGFSEDEIASAINSLVFE